MNNSQENKNEFLKKFKGNGEINKKFLKYEEGDIKYYREKDILLEDIVRDSEHFIRKKITDKDTKELILYSLFIFIVVAPLLLYAYYSPSMKSKQVKSSNYTVQNNANNKPINTGKSEVNSSPNINGEEVKQDTGIKSFTNTKNNSELDEQVESIDFQSYISYVELEANRLHNVNINKLKSYFGNKSNKTGLTNTIKKSYDSQEKLYIYLMTYKDNFKSQNQQAEINELESLLLDDIYRSKLLLEVISSDLRRSAVDSIYLEK